MGLKSPIVTPKSDGMLQIPMVWHAKVWWFGCSRQSPMVKNTKVWWSTPMRQTVMVSPPKLDGLIKIHKSFFIICSEGCAPIKLYQCKIHKNVNPFLQYKNFIFGCWFWIACKDVVMTGCNTCCYLGTIGFWLGRPLDLSGCSNLCKPSYFGIKDHCTLTCFGEEPLDFGVCIGKKPSDFGAVHWTLESYIYMYIKVFHKIFIFLYFEVCQKLRKILLLTRVMRIQSLVTTMATVQI